jgi:acyl-CoA thioesterase FadM
MMGTLGGLFMVRHVEIEYRGVAAAFDRVNVETWVESAGGVRLVRCTGFRKAETGQDIVVARVEWVWIDTNRRPRRVPQQIIDAVLPAAASATSADAST